ncbi:MAG: TetR/AcrR family transcriptional regulator [Myxococcota bacterium]
MADRDGSPSRATSSLADASVADAPAMPRRAGSARRRSGGERRGASAEKRQLILDTAIQVFAEKGYPDTRISDIAKRAEIAYGLVYHYFRNKEEILDTIFLERWGEFIGGVRAIGGDDGPVEDKLRSIAELILSVHKNQPEWVKILIFEIQRSQRMLGRERMETIAALFEEIAGILREGQARGELRTDLDPEVACYIFVGGLDTVVTSRVLALMPADGASPEAEGAHYVQLAGTVVELFVRGMALPTPREPGTNRG